MGTSQSKTSDTQDTHKTSSSPVNQYVDFAPGNYEDNTNNGPLIPTMFRWPYGGRKAFIVGSFNNWKEKIPMAFSPEDNSFIVILNLSQGKHQFKYVIDNQNKTDPKYPSVSDGKGSLNNVIEVFPAPPDHLHSDHKHQQQGYQGGTPSSLNNNYMHNYYSATPSSPGSLSSSAASANQPRAIPARSMSPPSPPTRYPQSAPSSGARAIPIQAQHYQEGGYDSMARQRNGITNNRNTSMTNNNSIGSNSAYSSSPSTSASPSSHMMLGTTPDGFTQPSSSASPLSKTPQQVLAHMQQQYQQQKYLQQQEQYKTAYSTSLGNDAPPVTSPQPSEKNPATPIGASEENLNEYSEYGQVETEFIETKKTMPLLPPHLRYTPLNASNKYAQDPALLPVPLHVTVNHVYLCNRDKVRMIGITQRYKEKYSTLVLYKPVKPAESGQKHSTSQ